MSEGYDSVFVVAGVAEVDGIGAQPLVFGTAATVEDAELWVGELRSLRDLALELYNAGLDDEEENEQWAFLQNELCGYASYAGEMTIDWFGPFVARDGAI